jgi:hypothetical protein
MLFRFAGIFGWVAAFADVVIGRKKIKSSEVVLCPFVSASSSLVRPLPTLKPTLPCGYADAI